MRGYRFDGAVGVYSWKDRDHIEADVEEAKWIELIRKIEMEHSYGLARAIARHWERVEGLNLVNIDLEEAVEIYKALQYTVPR